MNAVVKFVFGMWVLTMIVGAVLAVTIPNVQSTEHTCGRDDRCVSRMLSLPGTGDQ